MFSIRGYELLILVVILPSEERGRASLTEVWIYVPPGLDTKQAKLREGSSAREMNQANEAGEVQNAKYKQPRIGRQTYGNCH